MGTKLELDMPKCLVQVGGRCAIDYQIESLSGVEQLRVVVGFMEERVMEHARKLRDDIVFVRNPNYAHSPYMQSLYLGTRGFEDDFLVVDGDILIDPVDFTGFLSNCDGRNSMLAITDSKSENAVYVKLDVAERKVLAFTESERSEYEWCGLAYLHGIPVNRDADSLFRELSRYLPLSALRVKCYDLDTPEDLENALVNFKPRLDPLCR
jgi:choline kinase